jgi:hypothetical protein
MRIRARIRANRMRFAKIGSANQVRISGANQVRIRCESGANQVCESDANLVRISVNRCDHNATVCTGHTLDSHIVLLVGVLCFT